MTIHVSFQVQSLVAMRENKYILENLSHCLRSKILARPSREAILELSLFPLNQRCTQFMLLNNALDYEYPIHDLFFYSSYLYLEASNRESHSRELLLTQKIFLFIQIWCLVYPTYSRNALLINITQSLTIQRKIY